MAARIPVSWLILLLIVGVFAFFGYHIIQASSTTDEKPDAVPQALQTLGAIAKSNYPGGPQLSPAYEMYDDGNNQEMPHAPVVQTVAAPNRMPAVPGQTEDDLRAPEQLQATPPSTHYDIPESMDPMNRTVHMDAEFGSNLRHPEQMVEHQPSTGMGHVVASGLGSEASSPGGNSMVGYAPEMAQNGGEFMSGITAFDMSEMGSSFSML
jgi:hypothetical protein